LAFLLAVSDSLKFCCFVSAGWCSLFLLGVDSFQVIQTTAVAAVFMEVFFVLDTSGGGSWTLEHLNIAYTRWQCKIWRSLETFGILNKPSSGCHTYGSVRR